MEQDSSIGEEAGSPAENVTVTIREYGSVLREDRPNE